MKISIKTPIIPKQVARFVENEKEHYPDKTNVELLYDIERKTMLLKNNSLYTYIASHEDEVFIAICFGYKIEEDLHK